MDGNPKQQVAEKLRSSSSVLVTVSNDPSVDQLAAALGLSLMLTKLGKHTTTVFSGKIPNAIEFLNPEKTFDSTVDGLRDFIISLDKEKADKLRYKVEDDVVKIFITPYKSKITQDDLNFSQGDFNVDLVVALGVHKRGELDNAITAHGRILHDATIVTINDGKGKDGNLGAVDWTEDSASCLSEMLVSISEALEGGILDQQMSTAFLTGIVAATDRFKNDQTTPKVMTMAAQLMAAGANQQLIATNLQAKGSNKSKKDHDKSQDEKAGDDFAREDHTMAIDRDKKAKDEDQEEDSKELDQEGLLADIENAVHAKHLKLDDTGRTKHLDDEDPAIKQLEDDLSHDSSSNLLDLEDKLKNFDPDDPIGQDMPDESSQPQEDKPSEPQQDGPIGKVKSLGDSAYEDQKPALGGTFNATAAEAHDRREEERQMAVNKEILSHKNIAAPAHLEDPAGEINKNDVPDSASLMEDLEAARREVEEAMDSAEFAGGGNQPIQALNASPMPMDSGEMEDFNLPQMQNAPQNFNQPQQMGGMQQSMPPMNNGGMQQQMPQQPMNNGGMQPMNGGMQQPMNPLFNMPQQPMNNGGMQQQMPQMNNGGMQPMNGGMQPGQMNMPQNNGNGSPPPMPPSAPPPMPPFN